MPERQTNHVCAHRAHNWSIFNDLRSHAVMTHAGRAELDSKWAIFRPPSEFDSLKQFSIWQSTLPSLLTPLLAHAIQNVKYEMNSLYEFHISPSISTNWISAFKLSVFEMAMIRGEYLLTKKFEAKNNAATGPPLSMELMFFSHWLRSSTTALILSVIMHNLGVALQLVSKSSFTRILALIFEKSPISESTLWLPDGTSCSLRDLEVYTNAILART